MLSGPQDLLIELSRPARQPQQERIYDVSPSQIRGILAMVATLRGRSQSGQIQLDVKVQMPVRFRGTQQYASVSLTAERHFYTPSNDQLLYRATPESGPIFYELQQFDPATEPFILDFIESQDESLLRHRHSRARYVALFRGPGNILVVQFAELEYLQGAVSVCNWLGYDYHERIPVVYDGTQALEIM